MRIGQRCYYRGQPCRISGVNATTYTIRLDAGPVKIVAKKSVAFVPPGFNDKMTLAKAAARIERGSTIGYRLVTDDDRKRYTDEELRFAVCLSLPPKMVRLELRSLKREQAKAKA